ncbi:MAG: hypothetical protein WA151_03040 [Desulfatirhabdiaceae bacterium]
MFDLAIAQARFAVPLMHHYPEIMLVGFVLMSIKMLVQSGESSCLLTIEDQIAGIEKSHFPKLVIIE